ncbi:MAG: hypothetical protein LBO09_08585 [Candidatus Peribacteria bacterium]|jgi:hypothetical protein|nr:hypothetical protein [Candidatus Peribacteria bacterium]
MMEKTVEQVPTSKQPYTDEQISTLREKQPESLKQKGRALIISAVGKLFHTLIDRKSTNLEEISKTYIEKTKVKITIDETSKQAIQKFKQEGRGIIMSNHKAINFNDYLPVIAEVGNPDIVYTASHNFAMNRREFPDTKFRPVNLGKTSYKKAKITNDVAQQDIDTIAHKGYVYLLPSGEDNKPEATFKGLSKKFIKDSPADLPILIIHIDHNYPEGMRGYADTLLALLTKKELGEVSITAHLTSAKDFQEKLAQGEQLSR